MFNILKERDKVGQPTDSKNIVLSKSNHQDGNGHIPVPT